MLNHIDDKGIYTDLLREFRDHGHNVCRLCKRKKIKFTYWFVNEKGVNFLRVKIGNITKTNIIEKGISTIRIESLFLKQ